jgi:glycerol kinase
MRVDGAAARSDLLMQTQADLLDVRLARPANVETTALGAAMLAGLGVGVWKDEAELAAGDRVERVFEPRASRAETARMREQWARALERSKEWARPEDDEAGVGGL